MQKFTNLRKFLFCLFGLSALAGFSASAQTLEPNYGAPATPVQVANGAAVFMIKIKGGATACAGPSTLNVVLPTGYVFVSGSAVVTHGGSTLSETSANNNTAVFSVSNIPASPDSTTISYQAYAGCGVIGGSNTTINYSLTGSCSGTATATAVVNAQNAQLNITNITNSAYSGTGGGTYNRVITITNNGLGTIDTIYLNSVSTTGITVTGFSANTGTISATANGYRIVAPTADGHLGPNETVLITETVSLSNCGAIPLTATTNYKAWYGPGVAECTTVSNVATAGATIGVGAPNLSVLFITSPFMSCFGQDINEIVRFVNNGTGTASSLHFNVTSGSKSNLAAQQRFCKTGSFTYHIGSAGISMPVTIDSTLNYTTPAACATADMQGFVYISLPDLAPGDTLFLNYIDKTCCLTEADFCAYGGVVSPATSVMGTYKNSCGAVKATTNAGSSAMTSYISVNPAFPGTILSGTPSALRYDIPSASGGVMYSTGSLLTLSWTFSSNLAFSGLSSDLTVRKADGSNATPQSFTYDPVTKILTATYANMNISDLSGGNITMQGVSADCINGSSGQGNVAFKALYSPGSCTSGCTLPVLCSGFSFVNVLCPCTSATGGLNTQSFTLLRTSYGLPDNNNDRAVDATGTIDTTLIRRDLVMTGDTVRATFIGKELITASSPAFTNGYAALTGAGSFSALYANLHIYRNGALLINAPNYPMDTANKKVDFSPAALAANGYGAYTFTSNDSVVIDQYLRVSYYSPTATTVLSMNGQFYLSNIANPVQSSDMYGCPVNITQNVGYISMGTTPLSNWGSNTTSCDTSFAYMTIYASTRGNFQTIYNNVFPYEVRPTLQLDTILVSQPNGYIPAGMTLKIYRPNGTNGSLNSTFNLMPVSTVGGIMTFVVPANSVVVADESSYASIVIQWVGSCSPPYTSTYNVTPIFNKRGSYGGPRSATSYPVTLTSNFAPGVTASASQPVATSASDTTVWEIQLSDTTNNLAKNVWMGKNGVSSLSIASIQQLSGPGGTVTANLPSVNGVFQLGSISGNTTQYYRITGVSSNCIRDSFNLAYGINCGGYPVSVGAASCQMSLTLGVIRQTPALQLNIVSQPSAPLNLCDPVTYELDVVNSGLGAANGLSVRVQLPVTGGMDYIAGTLGLKYPASTSSYTTLADANVVISGTNMVINIPAAALASLPGTGNYRVTFQLKTLACQFTSGEKITFRPSGRNACGNTILGTAVTSNRINLNGVPPVVPVFNITSSATPVQACGSGTVTSTYQFKLVSSSTIPTSAVDGFRITLPSGWTMNTAVTYSHNPASGSYSMSPATGVYDFYTGVGLVPGDSIVFTTTLTANAAALSCGNTDPIVESGFVQFTASCLASTPVIVCDMKQLLDPENALTTINVQRPSYSFSAVSGAGSGTHVQGAVTLAHTDSIFVAQNVTLSLYNDVNANGSYDAGEPLLGSGSYALTNTASQTIAYDIATNVNSNSTLNMLLVATFGCACDSLQYSLANVALPIEFSQFMATADGCEVTLNWDYKAMDMVVAGFDIQRTSSKANSWTTVGHVAADQYSYTDQVPGSGKWIYRLRAVSGIKSAYSKQVMVQSDCHTGSVNVYPSPARDLMYIELSGTDATDAMYNITDNLGRLVRKGNLQSNSKNQVNINDLTPGIYQVQVNDGGVVTVKSIEIAQ